MSTPEDGAGELGRIFSEEAAEHLDAMVGCLLALEAGSASPDATEILFRHAHSIKGSAGMVGLGEAGTIAAAIEDVLQAARESGSLRAAQAEPLLRATDALRRAVAGETGIAAPAAAALAELAGSRQRGTGDGRSGNGRRANEPGNRSDERSAAASPASEAPAAEATASAESGPAREATGQAAPRSIRVAAHKVDRLLDAVGETVLHNRRLEHVLAESAHRAEEGLEREVGHSERLLGELHEAVLELRTVPLSSVTGPLPRAVRDLAAAEGKEVDLQITGSETQFDRTLLDGMADLLGHLLRNAVAHGIELPNEREAADKPRRGRLELHAQPRGDRVAIEVRDDGRGVARQVLAEASRRGCSLVDVLAQAGFSTARGVSDIAGRGVGLDAVKRHVEAVGGSLAIDSEPGSGTRTALLLPISLALQRVLIVRRGSQRFGLPLASVREAVAVERMMMLTGQSSIEVRGECLRLSDLASVLGMAAGQLPEVPRALVLDAASGRVALACDRVIGEEEVLVKPLDGSLQTSVGCLGATILGDGGVMLILDPADLIRAAQQRSGRVRVQDSAVERARQAPKVLVVDDQFTVRELQRSILRAAGYRVEVACDGREALDELGAKEDFDMVVTDLQMPEMDGLALLAAIRSDPRRSSLPVVVVTSHGSEEDRKRGAEAGADAYIVKDEFDQQALLETVERLVGAQ